MSGRQAGEQPASRARDMANVLAGLALFWTYLFWSQFLVIWYGNLSSEVDFIMARIGASRAIGWIILATGCALPPVVFVPQWGKRILAMRLVTPLIVVGLWLERWLLVSPDLPKASALGTVAITAVCAAAFFLSVRLDVGRSGARIDVHANQRQVL